MSIEHRARNKDPSTSHDAADEVKSFAYTHYEEIRKALLVGDATIYEIANRTGLTQVQVSRRLPEMEELGIAFPNGDVRLSPTKRKCRVWTLPL